MYLFVLVKHSYSRTVPNYIVLPILLHINWEVIKTIHDGQTSWAFRFSRETPISRSHGGNIKSSMFHAFCREFLKQLPFFTRSKFQTTPVKNIAHNFPLNIPGMYNNLYSDRDATMSRPADDFIWRLYVHSFVSTVGQTLS